MQVPRRMSRIFPTHFLSDLWIKGTVARQVSLQREFVDAAALYQSPALLDYAIIPSGFKSRHHYCRIYLGELKGSSCFCSIGSRPCERNLSDKQRAFLFLSGVSLTGRQSLLSGISSVELISSATVFLR